MPNITYTETVECWGVFEARFCGKTDGNPFTDYSIYATFTHAGISVKVSGFYDGGGVYAVRFMPSFTGEYTFIVEGSFSDDTFQGKFISTRAVTENNHGTVRVRGYHFEYEDGTPYYPIGTTAYVWNLQDEETRNKTIETLSNGYFNKIRFCVFPKHYQYNLHEPVTYPYEGTPCKIDVNAPGGILSLKGVQPGNNWDFTRFNPAHFRLVEECIEKLGKLGIEADLICMHPYDRWGFSEMTPEQDGLYWKYIIARFAAYRNVWWSLANEYDLLHAKTIADWERYAQIILENDPYNHPRSIHNCREMYDHSRPWITHSSIQRQDLYKCAEYTDEFRVRYGKPAVLDEIAYEGNINHGWGNISGQELTRRFWEASMRGGYATHGETYDGDRLWWSHGGELLGDSPERIRFLRGILAQTPGSGLKRATGLWDEVVATAEGSGMGDSGYYIYYYGFNRPNRRSFHFAPEHSYSVEIIDTWGMTITPAGVFSGDFTVNLPGREYMAVRLKRV